MTVYLNTKTSYGVETVDSVSLQDFPNAKEFRKEKAKLIKEYALNGVICYFSQRKAKN